MLDRNAINALLDLVGGKRVDLDDLISDFLADAPNQLLALEAAAAAGDCLAVKRGAHSLKSNCRDLGAHALEQLCAALEADLSDSGAVSDLSGRMALILSVWPGVLDALEAELTGTALP